MVRHLTVPVQIGKVIIGGGNSVVIQSMTNTDTADIDATVKQVISLTDAGSEIVRLTVNNSQAAKALPAIKNKLLQANYTTPLVGCFHYNGHTLMTEIPECIEALDKLRINPGNVGFGKKRDIQFDVCIEQVVKYKKPVRIGVNWGSLDQELLKNLMDQNAAQTSGVRSAHEVMIDALVLSALNSAKRAEEVGLPKNQIVVSCKTSKVKDLIEVYQRLAKLSNYALHVGLTEAGMGQQAIISSASALAILLHYGIGDTIRVSITPEPGGSRDTEVKVCKEILQSLDIRAFAPQVTSCPGCGRTTSDYFQRLTQEINGYIEHQMAIWNKLNPKVKEMKIAVMGCIVNGPGESKHANIGISLPGTGESPVAPVFIDGHKTHTLRGDNIANDFKDILSKYVMEKYKL